MDDARARLPELDAILASRALKEVEDLLIGHNRPLQAYVALIWGDKGEAQNILVGPSLHLPPLE